MTTAALLVLACLQPAPARREVEELLRRFERDVQEETVRLVLVAELAALGDAAQGPVAERLAAELRLGVETPLAPALIDALQGRPGALAPLQAAFGDPATPPAGRVGLAAGLAQLLDTLSWRPGLLSLALDPGMPWPERLRAAALLQEVGADGTPDLLERLYRETPGRPPAEQMDLVELLASVGASGLLGLLKEDARFDPSARRLASAAVRPLPAEEPREGLVPARGPLRPVVKKRETGPEGSLTIPLVGAGVAATVMLAALLVLRRRSP